MFSTLVSLLAAAAPQVKEGQAIAFGLGVGLGAVGAGIGIAVQGLALVALHARLLSVIPPLG